MKDTRAPIKVRPETRKALLQAKIHPRETFDDVITRLLQGRTPNDS